MKFLCKTTFKWMEMFKDFSLFLTKPYPFYNQNKIEWWTWFLSNDLRFLRQEHFKWKISTLPYSLDLLSHICFLSHLFPLSNIEKSMTMLNYKLVLPKRPHISLLTQRLLNYFLAPGYVWLSFSNQHIFFPS